jgi:DNA-binding CsgD family transcriptional regulator
LSDGRPYTARAMPAEVVGRSLELDAIRAVLASASERPVALLLEGEPGIGKTALWREGLAASEEKGFRSLVTRASEAEAQLPFVGLIDLLAGVLDEALPELPAPQARILETALLRAEPAGSPADHLAVSLACLRVLRGLADRDPLALAVDDLQWLDRSSSRALAFCLRRFESRPVCLVATRRIEGDLALTAELERALGEVRLERLALGPLAGNALDLVLRDHLGLRLSPPRLAVLLERSGGNPLHALELGRAVQAGATLAPGAPLAVPPSLNGLVEARVKSLSPGCRELLLEAAALARPSLSVFAGREELLEEAVDASLLELDGEDLRFAHPLFGSAVYGRASSARRRVAHRALAKRLADPEERALHLALAADGPDEVVASEIEEAAARAWARGAPDAAAELAEHARRLTPQEREDDWGRRGLAAADYYVTAGDGPAAVAILEELIRALPAGRRRALALLLLTQTSTSDFERSLELLEQALDESSEDRALQARVHLDIADTVSALAGHTERLDRHLELAVRLAEQSGDEQILCVALTFLAAHRFWSGSGVEHELIERVLALDLTPEHELIERARALDLTPTISRVEPPHTTLACILMRSRQPAEGRVLLERDLAEAVARGSVSNEVTVLIHLVELECLAANFRRADALGQRCLDLGRQLDIANARHALLYASALADHYRGRVQRARESACAGSAAARAMGDAGWEIANELVLGMVALSLGEAETACAHLRPLPERIAARGYVEPLDVFSEAAEALILAGELDAAEPLVTQLEELGTRLDRVWAKATGARCRGLLEASRGHFDTALATLESAREHHERLGNPFERARTDLARGIVLRRARKKGQANGELANALATFDQLGTPLWAERAREEIRRIGLRPSRDGGLTDTEQKVAELVAAGRTNKEVAGELFLSVKTVEANLSRIYRKLGVRSRTELSRRLG